MSNEIGDPTLMQAVLSGTGSSNCRGRAQQILMLQQKVNKLQLKLNELQAKPNDSKNKDAHSSTGIYTNFYQQFAKYLIKNMYCN